MKMKTHTLPEGTREELWALGERREMAGAVNELMRRRAIQFEGKQYQIFGRTRGDKQASPTALQRQRAVTINQKQKARQKGLVHLGGLK